MAKPAGRWPATAALLLVVAIGVTACDGGRASSSWAEPTSTVPPPTLLLTPEDGATGELLSTEVGTRTDGQISSVELVSEDGDRIEGSLREDGSSWVPERPLEPTTGYTATVTSTGGSGLTTSDTTSFTTMAAPAPRTGTGLYLFDGGEYGVAMPVVVEFVAPVPPDARAGVQKRLFVTTDPPQPGVWHWVENGSQAFYRAREHWQPGTELDVRIALDGHPTGDGRYGDTDRSATATIGSRVELEVDNGRKSMTVIEDGEVTRTMPVSLGKASTPSSSGRMVVMTRERQTVFDTFDELGPGEGYRIDIEYALRLTWGGEFIHAAPWSVADQGERNVSHGCVNLSTRNARWLFGVVKVGDPVTVRGTGQELAQGNGWTAWDLSWEDFVAGSALPVPAELLGD
jgi:lipoprotein-anchoring transpeptidase ErfK/SrfK